MCIYIYIYLFISTVALLGRPRGRARREGAPQGRSGDGRLHTYIHTHIHTLRGRKMSKLVKDLSLGVN